MISSVPAPDSSAPAPTRRLELTLRRPWLGWYPKPTIVLEGRGQPAQWGTGTWQVPCEKPTTVRVFLFNRLWKFGAADFCLGIEQSPVLVYSAPWLPFLPGRFRTTADIVRRGPRATP